MIPGSTLACYRTPRSLSRLQLPRSDKQIDPRAPVRHGVALCQSSVGWQLRHPAAHTGQPRLGRLRIGASAARIFSAGASRIHTDSGQIQTLSLQQLAQLGLTTGQQLTCLLIIRSEAHMRLLTVKLHLNLNRLALVLYGKCGILRLLMDPEGDLFGDFLLALGGCSRLAIHARLRVRCVLATALHIPAGCTHGQAGRCRDCLMRAGTWARFAHRLGFGRLG